MIFFSNRWLQKTAGAEHAAHIEARPLARVDRVARRSDTRVDLPIAPRCQRDSPTAARMPRCSRATPAAAAAMPRNHPTEESTSS